MLGLHAEREKNEVNFDVLSVPADVFKACGQHDRCTWCGELLGLGATEDMMRGAEEAASDAVAQRRCESHAAVERRRTLIEALHKMLKKRMSALGPTTARASRRCLYPQAFRSEQPTSRPSRGRARRPQVMRRCVTEPGPPYPGAQQPEHARLPCCCCNALARKQKK